MVTSVRLAGALLLAATVSAAAADLSYQVTNYSDLTIMEIYASPAGEGAWGEDLLYAQVLPRGEAHTLLVPDGTTRCDYDLRLIFENGRELVEAAQVCDAPSYTVRSAP
jgi:hypothetical protein